MKVVVGVGVMVGVMVGVEGGGSRCPQKEQ